MQGLEKLKALADSLPKEYKEHALSLVHKMGQVIEGIGDKPIEWRPDNVKVVQATTDRSKLPRGATIGSIIMGEEIVEQPLKVYPLRMWDTRQLWDQDRDNPKLLCWSPDGVVGYTLGRKCKGCEYGKFNTETNRSECNKSKTAMFVTNDLTKIGSVNFSKTNYANGKDWENLMKKAGVATFKRTYNLKTEPNKKYKNVEALIVDTSTEATPKEIVDFLQELFDRSTADRKAYVEQIHKIVTDKQQAMAALEAPPVDSADALILVEQTTSAPTASQASKYTV